MNAESDRARNSLNRPADDASVIEWVRWCSGPPLCWEVTPVERPRLGDEASGKRPILSEWPYRESLGEEEIAMYWGRGIPFNVGLICGERSDLVVLDFDEPEWYCRWARRHPEAAQTLTAARDNAEPGRVHLYFSTEESDVPDSLTKTANGWGDLLSSGRQVVAPPSVHYSGGRYRFVNQNMPLPWRDEYTPEPMRASGSPRVVVPGVDIRGAGAASMPRRWLAMLEMGAPKGVRNDAAFKIAVQLRDGGLPEDAVTAKVLGFAARCTPPLPEREARAVVRSAFTRPPREPSAKSAGPPPPVAPPSATVSTLGEDPWPDPQPINAVDVPLVPWPWDAFPQVLGNMGRAIVESIGTSHELPGLGLACAASMALRNKVRVEIKPGHLQFGNIYGLAVLPPGEKKTPVGKVLLPPFTDWQSEQQAVFRDEQNRWKARARHAKVRIAQAEKRLEKAVGADAKVIEQQIAEQERILAEKPMPPVLLANDATSEALALRMRDNGGAIGVFTSEGRKVLAIAGGRYSKGNDPDLSLWLAAYSGDYWRCDRASADREPFELHEPVLAALVMSQPDTLRAMGESAEMRDSGFLGRWEYICPDSTVGHYHAGVIDRGVVERYAIAIRRLIEMPMSVGAHERAVPHKVSLTPAAFDLWVEYHDRLVAESKETQAVAPGPFQQYLVKLPERIARIALIFHAVREVGDGRPLGQIECDEIERAFRVAEALKQHGKRAFGMMGQSAEHAKARILWRTLHDRREKFRAEREREGLGALVAVKPKDVARYGWAGIGDCEEARRVLDVLAVKGWLREETLPGGGRGPNHVLYHLHPNPPDRCVDR